MTLLERRPFFALLLTAAVLFVAANLFIAPRSHRMSYHAMLDTIQAPGNPSLILVGNSLLLNVEDRTLDRATARAGLATSTLNTALSGAWPPEQRLLFEYSLQHHSSLRILVVGFYDFQLTQPDHSGVGDLIFGRQVGIDPRLPLQQVAAAYQFSPARTLELRIVRDVPLFAYRAGAWGRVEFLRRALARLGIPNGDAEHDNDGLEADSPQAFDGEALAFAHQPLRFNASFDAIFQKARAHGMQIVAVVMPMSPNHLRTFYDRPSWPRYLDALGSAARAENLPIHFIDASRWEPGQNPGQNAFDDNLHMSPAAAADFTRHLGPALARTLQP